MSTPLVSIICPVYNGASYLEETLASVVGQTYPKVELIVIDGGSTDGTASVVEKFGDRITRFVSEPDEGMYDALAKGFSLASGEIVGYINAGDFLNSYAIETAVRIFTEHEVQWITGCRSICNEQSVVTHVDLPFRYLNKLIQVGSYVNHLPFIQQETCFWTRDLVDKMDLERFRQFRYAGDYFLWWTLSHYATLEVVSCPLGVFKKHSGQLSEDRQAYLNEVNSFTSNRKFTHILLEKLELIGWALHPYLRSLISNRVLRYDHKAKNWVRSFQ
tara:strand:+ start:3825 stop:4646 length:822 start_codon:yes stop_codon:yes gene_type:complete